MAILEGAKGSKGPEGPKSPKRPKDQKGPKGPNQPEEYKGSATRQTMKIANSHEQFIKYRNRTLRG